MCSICTSLSPLVVKIKLDNLKISKLRFSSQVDNTVGFTIKPALCKALCAFLQLIPNLVRFTKTKFVSVPLHKIVMPSSSSPF